MTIISTKKFQWIFQSLEFFLPRDQGKTSKLNVEIASLCIVIFRMITSFMVVMMMISDNDLTIRARGANAAAKLVPG
jgi:hypothetical protein